MNLKQLFKINIELKRLKINSLIVNNKQRDDKTYNPITTKCKKSIKNIEKHKKVWYYIFVNGITKRKDGVYE